MRYIVEVGYKTFLFNDPDEALAFARVAKEHYSDDGKEIEVSIRLVYSKED